MSSTKAHWPPTNRRVWVAREDRVAYGQALDGRAMGRPPFFVGCSDA